MTLQLHGFCDASQVAYAGVVYLRAVYEDTSTSMSLVFFKTRVAPLTTATIPRLELCGAQLLSKLLQTVRDSLYIPLHGVFAWCDSITLSWIHTTPSKLKTFVANRVADTTARVPASHWRYVPMAQNPADIASRGADPKELLESTQWWDGPQWLSLSPDNWPVRLDLVKEKEPPDLKPRVMLARPPDEDFSLRFSSYNHMLRIIAWFRRFAANAKTSGTEKRMLEPMLQLQEIEESKRVLLQLSQARHFASDIATLWRSKELPTRSKIADRRPFIDQHRILRVGGRLGRADLEQSAKHPAILHRRDNLSRLMCRHIHELNQHIGPTGLLGLLSSDYRIVGAKYLVREISRSCVTCRKVYARTSEQLMGQLPPTRLTPAPAFTHVGADFAGPFTLKKGHTRKPTFIKAYVCLFICLSMKAIHLELVMDLTVEAFVACLKRFVARRGCPETLHTDNGTNFVGARKEISALYDLLESHDTQEKFGLCCTVQRIQWTHTPGRAPHFGGIWESAVRSMKTLLLKSVGVQRLTSEEFYTVLAEVEATLNSRPLVPLDSTPTDGVQALTPGHFLVGRPLRALPEKTDQTSSISSLRRWNLCQRLSAEFWSRWSKEYIHLLHRHHKWRHTKPDMRVGDIVLLKDQELFSRSWPLARVEKSHPDEDGLVRVATVRTEKGTYLRPITKLVPLLSEGEDSSGQTVARGEDVQDSTSLHRAMEEDAATPVELGGGATK